MAKKASLKVTKDSFRGIYRDLRLFAARDGRKVIEKLAGDEAVELVKRTPVATGQAASAWVPGSRKLNRVPPAIHPKKGKRDKRSVGENMGSIEIKETKTTFTIRLINRVKHFFWLERKYKIIARSMRAMRGKFGPTFTKAMRANRGKIGRRK